VGASAARRLTLVVSSLEPGGAERVVATLANSWAHAGQGVTLLTLDDGRRQPFYALDRAVRHRPLALAGLSHGWRERVTANARRVRALRRAIRASEPTLILSFTDTTNVLALCATMGLRIPVVVSEHTDLERHPLPAPWKVLRRVTYRWAAAIVTPTAEARALLPARLRPRTRVIPNPIPAPTPPRPPRGSDTGLVVSVGRLSPEKGHDRLLEAFARIAARHPMWRLVIAGDGSERAALEALRDRLGLGARVELPGSVKDVGGLLARADLYVLASRREVFPMALCEAMAAGLPTVVMEYRPGVREIVRDGVDGVLVPAGDVEALGDAMARLMGDAGERRRLGARAGEIVERFGVDRVLGQWEALFRELPRRRGRAPAPGAAGREDRAR
jgi:GalNAc-alpha-(1->4)-GalNAc-alpha-(1->3)-diNAcBac-PP-undecaprenol alpha-1,4-N-acetyl-D-galactosaminyltransferase